MKRPQFLVAFAGLLACICVCAQSAGAAAAPSLITGLVRDSDGKLLQGARVRLSLGALSSTAITGADGLYRFDNLPAADGYSLRATARKYEAEDERDVATLAGATTRVDFDLLPTRAAATGIIVGTVLDSAGQPVRGARVDVLTGASCGHASANRAGRYRITGLRAGAYSLSVAGAGLAPKVVDQVDVQSRNPAEANVTLSAPSSDAAGTFFGVVRDEQGHALPGATVEVVSGPTPGSTAAGDEGRYTLPGLAPGTYALRASMAGYLGNTWDGIRLEAGHEVRVDFALRSQDQPQFGSIAGLVLDGDGHPISGAHVAVVTGPTQRAADTNADGHYELNELLPGAYVIRATKDGFNPGQADGHVVAGQQLIRNITLTHVAAQVGHIVGHVTDRNGHAIVGATILLVEVRSTTTNGDGNYDFGDVVPGVYAVRASKDGYITQTRQPVAVHAGETVHVDFSLEAGGPAPGRIVGLVTDGEGHALAGVAIQIIGGASAATGVNGGYEINGVTPGTYSVRASKDGYITQTRDGVVVAAGQATHVDFTLQHVPPPPGRFVGNVRNADGALLPEVTVKIIDGPVLKQTSTNASGHYELNELPAGSYKLQVSRTGYLTVTSEVLVLGAGATRELNFTLHPAQ